MEIYMDEIAKGNNVTLETLENGQLVNKLDEITVILEDNKITGAYEGYYYEIDSNLNVKILDKVSGIIFGYTLSPERYTKGNVTLTLNVSSTQGDITNIEAPSSLTKNEDGTYTIAQNGNYEFKVTDTAGNTITKTVKVQKIDTEAPKDFTPTVSEENITKTGFTITAEAEDAEATETSVQSGIARYEYYVNGTKYDTKIITELEKGTDYTVYVIAYDNADNSKKSREITVTTKSGERLYIIRNGVDNTELTGGWEGLPYVSYNETGTLTFENGYANYVGTQVYNVYKKATVNSIDWSQYNTINMKMKAYNEGTGFATYGAVEVSVINSKSAFGTSGYDSRLVACEYITAPTLNQEIKLSATLPTEYVENTYISVGMHRCSMYIYDVWLEKDN